MTAGDWSPIPPGGYRLPPFLPHTPHPKQAIFLGLHHVREALYGGAAGGGKSDALIMDALQYWDVPGYAALIVRRTFPDLAQPGAIMDRAKSWLIPAGIQWHEGQHVFTFPSGARLKFGYLNTPNDRYGYQSAEFQYVGIDEATQFEEGDYTYLMTRVRRPADLDGSAALARVPLRGRLASNPGNIGHEWVKQRFIPYVDEVTGEAQFPRDESGKARVFIPARLADNPSLDAEAYIENLQELDPITRAQLLNGDWGVRPPGEVFDTKRFVYAYWDTEAAGWRDAATGLRDLTPFRWVRFWDLASTKKRPSTRSDPDYTAGVLMGRTRNDDILVRDVKRFRGTPAEVEALIRQTAEEDRDQGYGRTVRIEQEPGSSGEFTIDRFARVLLGWDFEGVRSTGPKEERARSYAAAVGKGLVFVPSGAPWLPAYFGELEAFPNDGLHDDQVDGSSGAFNFLAETYVPGSAAVTPPKVGPGHSPYAAGRGSSPFAARRRSTFGAR